MLISSRKDASSAACAVSPCSAALGSACGLVLLCLLSAPASAALSDTLHPFVSAMYSYDDNLFRLPEAAAGMGGRRSDTTRQLQAGVSFSRPIGRQVLSGQAKASSVSFDHFDQLNYTGKELSGTWEWHLANHLEGRVGASYVQSLTPFADTHSDQRNLRVQRRQFANGAWRFHPSWRVRAGFTRDKFSYDLREQRGNDRVEDLAETGVDYLASSGSRVGLALRQFKGRYDTPHSIGGSVVDVGYRQDEVKLDVYWLFGGVTQVQMLAGWAKRKHNFFTERDTSGLNGRATVYWRPLGKLGFNASAWRDFAAVESSIVNSSLNKGVSLGANYDLSAKLKAEASVRREKRDFGRASGFALPGDATDTSRLASVSLNYAARPSVQIGVSAFHDVRTGSPLVGTSSYRANGMSVNVNAQF
jgi:exopolysaccharide biosynthesis operon protein EpsL